MQSNKWAVPGKWTLVKGFRSGSDISFWRPWARVFTPAKTVSLLGLMTLKAAASAPTCKDLIVEILTILISNEQLWEFRYSLGNLKLIIWSTNNLKFAYGIYKKKSWQIVPSLPPFHLGWKCQTPQYITRHSTGNGGLIIFSIDNKHRNKYIYNYFYYSK